MGIGWMWAFLIGQALNHVTGQAVPDPSACFFWEGAIYGHGHCYKMFKAESVSRRQAETECASFTSGGTLAEVKDVSHLSDLMALCQDQGVTAWLAPTTIGNGTQDLYNPSTPFMPLPLPDTAWVEGQPYAPSSGLYCLAANQDGGLETRDCLNEIANGFVCQQEVDTVCDKVLPGSVYFLGSCFLYRSKPLNHTRAQAKCFNLDAFLAEPSSPELFDFVRNMAASSPGNEWVGGVVKPRDNYTMLWRRSGIPVTSNTTYWGADPVSEPYKQMIMDEDSDSLFKTAPDYTKLSHICQHDVGQPCEWFYPSSVYADGLCFKLYTNPLPWNDAKKACEKDSAILAEMTSSQLVYHTVNQLAKKTPTPTPVFIGLTDVMNEGYFHWASTNKEVTSAKWAEGQPDATTARHDFVAIRTQGFDWLVLDDVTTAPYICQRDWKKAPLKRIGIVVPDMTGFHGNRQQEAWLEVMTHIRSHKVYIKLCDHAPGQGWECSMHHVTHDNSLVLALGAEFYSRPFGINSKALRIVVSHPATVTLHDVIDGVKVTSLLHPSLYSRALPSSYFLATSGLALGSEDDADSIVAILSMSKPVHVTCRFPGHVMANVRLDIGGVEMNVTGDVELNMMSHQTAILSLRGALDGLFVYSTHMVMVWLLSATYNPSIPGGVAYVMSPILPSLLTSDFYVTIPSITNDVTNKQGYITDRYTVINADADNVIEVKCLGDDIHTMTFDVLGMTSSTSVPADRFCIMTGSGPFYLTKHVHWSDGVKARTPCRTDIMPRRLWRKHYTLALTPDPDLVEVSLLLVVPDPYQYDVMMDGVQIEAACTKVQGSYLYGCHVDLIPLLPSATSGTPTHHFHIHQYASTFAAYVIMTSERDIRCQTLGVIDAISPKQPAISLDDVYQPRPLSTSTATPLGNLTTFPSTSVTTSTNTETTTKVLATPSPKSFSFSWSHDPSSNPATTPIPLPETLANLTWEERQLLLYNIELRLKIDARSTSAFKRRKSSADDVRPSSTAIGLVGVAVMVVVVGFIVGSDVTSALRIAYRVRCSTNTHATSR